MTMNGSRIKIYTLIIFLISLTSFVHGGTGFIVLGDSGTGTDKQYRVANGIQQVCDNRPCLFAIGLGDNIYESGPKNETDQQFIDKFEDPYQNLNFPFFMALGNHDNTLLIPGDGAYNYRGNYEVAYTEHSDKWKMPARYYGIEAGNGLFVAYDSNPMASYLPDANPYWWPRGTYVQEEKAWVKQTLTESDATWKFAFAHHPYLTNGRSSLEPTLAGPKPHDDFVEEAICDEADIIFAGHEHAQEILHNEQDDCGKTIFVTSGAAAKDGSKRRWFPRHDRYWDNFGDLGFMHGYLDGDQLTLRAYRVDDNGNAVLEHQEEFNK